MSVNIDGVITVAPNTPSGTYVMVYQICETGANPVNCSTASATVVVRNVIDANDDAPVTFNGLAGGTTASVIANDTLNGSTAIIGSGPGRVTISATGVVPAGLTLNANGTITVASNTAAGTYTINYTICEVGAVPANCSDAVATIVITFDQDLVVNQYISPNGDGLNDNFIITGIEYYPTNSVEIYNRWGVLVYEVLGYNNADKSFKGESEGRVTISTETQLPTGTYFYVLKYTKTNGEQRKKAGYLYINK